VSEVPAARSQRQKDPEFQAILSYTAILSQIKNKKKKKEIVCRGNKE
jgi:hypothetical protein